MKSNFFEIEISYKPKDLNFKRSRIVCSQDIYEILLEIFDNNLLNIKEECIALFLNENNNLTGFYRVSSGGITGTVIDIRLILGIALKSLSTKLIIAHTHPSGNLKPSASDVYLTERLKEAAALMNIKLLDHLIITIESFYSFSDKGEI